MSTARPLTRENVNAMLREVDLALQGQNMVGAVSAAERALDAGIEHPLLLALVAEQRRQTGWTLEAVNLAERARALAPREPQVLTVLAECLSAIGREAEAIEQLEAAVAAEPRYAPAWLTKARLHETRGEMAEAARAYEQAFEAEPRLADAAAKRAWLAARAGEGETARGWGARALGASPTSVTARLALIQADVLDGRYQGALAAAQQLNESTGLSSSNQALVQGLIADALDGLERTAEAFEAYRRSNDIFRQQYAGEVAMAAPVSPAETVRRMSAWFEASEPWPKPEVEAEDGEPATHVFLLGFPRSGVGAVEQALRAQPGVATLAHRNTFVSAIETYLDPDGGLQRLAVLDAEEAARLRRSYFEEVRRLGGDLSRPVFVDQLPLNSLALPLVARLFPHAKVLITRRDPRDVVLSCYRSRFPVTPLTFQFLDLQSAADLFDASMQLNDAYLRRLPLDVRAVVYEELARDPRRFGQGLGEYLGVEWSAGAVPGGDEKAAAGVGRWRRYEQELAPVLPALEPWVRRFGYATEGGEG
ncbi:MAG TPA: sulfotransferase [Caulobacteraceae bacterium]